MLPRLAIAALTLAIPAGLFQLLRPLLEASARRRLLYALLPLLWGLMLARHLPLAMAEAGALLPVSFAPLGDWATALPQWSADPHVIGFCQSLALLVGVAGSLVLLRRLGPRGSSWWLAGGSTLLLAGAGRWLVALS